tara:strand:+ start:1581 stop:1709 length:129 start_codon:yes stop_codon:yes gene_type:complete
MVFMRLTALIQLQNSLIVALEFAHIWIDVLLPTTFQGYEKKQ